VVLPYSFAAIGLIAGFAGLISLGTEIFLWLRDGQWYAISIKMILDYCNIHHKPLDMKGMQIIVSWIGNQELWLVAIVVYLLSLYWLRHIEFPEDG
jgi:hypothetical protein